MNGLVDWQLMNILSYHRESQHMTKESIASTSDSSPNQINAENLFQMYKQCVKTSSLYD